MAGLADLQAEFAETLDGLKHYVLKMRDENGHKKYRLRKGDAYRDARAFGARGVKKNYSSRNSNHKSRLAEDLILDVWTGTKWKYATKTSDYKEIGDLWHQMHPQAEWGGASRKGRARNDGNHFSFRYKGGW